METLRVDNLFARRSIRKFTSEPVTQEQVTVLLKAAMAAPSAANRKPWHFVVVTDAGLRNQMADHHPHAAMLREAPLCIVPCGEASLGVPDQPEYWVQDLAAATENILLAAVGLDLGAVWCGVHPVPERVAAVREILGIPETVTPFAYVAIGHAAESKEPRSQYDPERVHTNGW
ncbi:MAG: nitroreductase family protein [Anaerolineae bacterium]